MLHHLLLRIVVSLCFFLFPFISLIAQKSRTGNWWMYFGNNPISKKWNWWNEIQYRNYNISGDLEQLMLRTGIGYNLSDNNNNLLVGYGYIRGGNYGNGAEKVYSNEHRLFQQFITRQQFGRTGLQHRYRLEERFTENDFKLRFRYFLGLNIGLSRKVIRANTVYLSAYNEIFIHANSRPAFDRNRIYTALGYAFQKNLKLEIGYMTQVQEQKQRGQLQVALFNTLPLYPQNAVLD
ncbi:MAG TPA: DUF2490 domain-containing protein [Sediminibacterium sp.]|nr:DUF2490 domain-containing protein [Sediminibacterium sp.]